MKKKHTGNDRFLYLIILSFIFSIFLFSNVQAEVLGPGWHMKNAKPISHKAARAYFRKVKARKILNAGTFETFTAAPGSSTTVSDEIKELARSLQYDPKLIYDYVHNNIDYVPYYGSLKGATLTYLDGSGNDFDQASLMIALLRESSNHNSNIGTAQFAYGQMDIPGSNLINWLGIDDNGNILNSVLGSGSIPGTVYVYDFIDYNIAYAAVDRVWVRANINSIDYVFDPALKTYNYTNKIDIASASSYDRNSLLTAAQSGATIGSNYVQNMNESNIQSKLEEYSGNLVNTIQNQYPNSEISEIIGGKDIVQSNLITYQTSLPFTTRNITYWTDVPSNKKSTLRVQHEGIDHTFDVPEITGQRLTITYSGNTPQLRLNGNVIASGNSTTLGTKYDCIIKIDHPYAGPCDPTCQGTYADQEHTFKIESGASYAVVSDFGDTNDMLLQKRQRALSQYQADGLADTSEEVRGETLNIMGLTWMKETNLTDNLLSSLAENIKIRHHSVGLMAQEGGYYIDVPLATSSIINKHDVQENKWAHFKSYMLIASALEHGILEQLMGADKPGISTIKIFQITNSDNQKIFFADSSNFNSIKSQLQNYAQGTLDTLQSEVDGGSTLMLPESGDVGLGTWSGTGYISQYFDTDSGSIGMIISGGYHGGYSGWQGYVSPPVVNNTVSNQVYSSYTPINTYRNTTPVPIHTSIDPIDMASGAFLFDSTDLALGGGGAAGLAFARSYNSNMNFERIDTAKGSLGYGWTHNYDIYLDRHSHGDPGLGSRQPVDAAALILKLYAAMDLMKNEDTLTGWVTSSLASKWAVDQLIDNAVTVHLGSKLMEFIKLPDGSYSPPTGVTTKLIDNGTTFSLEERFGTTMNFNTDDKVTSITDIDGNTLSFTYSGERLTTITDAFNRTLTLNYSGDLLSSVSDSAGRSVSYGYTGDDLTSYTDPDSKVWGYGYTDPNNQHRMTTLTNPLSITTATNTYDSLGRVKSQTTPRQTGDATYKFYFSGFRNVEEDPDGYMLIYYYDKKGRPYITENQIGSQNHKEYDGQFHVTKTIDPRSNQTIFTYDGDHNLIETTNALTQYTDYIYDAQFRLTDTIDHLYRGVRILYDAEHHPYQSQYGVTYDTNYQPQDSGVFQTGTTYYPNGQAHTTTDGRNTVTTLTYDSYGSPQTAAVGTHPAVTTVHDQIGRITSLTDQVNTTTSFPTYNDRGLLKKKTDPLLKDTIMEYDDAGRLSYIIDRNLERTDYIYTRTGKLDTVTYHDASTVSFTYDHHDDLTQMQGPLGNTDYTYYPDHSLETLTDPHGFALGYTYDEAGNVTELTYPGNKKVKYTYDALNRLETVTIDWLTSKPVTTYHYDDAGRLDWIDNFNGSKTDYNYDNANRLTDLVNTTSDQSIISDYHFTLDGNGNRTQIVRYEPLSMALSLGLIDYTYNVEKNRLATAGTTGFGFDDEGQLSTKGATAYTFDIEHRLETIDGTDQFYYDGAGTRLKAVRNSVETRYVYDASGNLIAEADSNNVITKYFIHGAGLMAMVTPADEVYTYHFDAIGNTIAMTDSLENTVNMYAYTPFGVIANEVENVTQPFKYVGQYGVMAEDNGFYYMRARYYDPEIGRFISEDPIGFNGGDVNVYAYVGNNPVLLNDPNGQCPWCVGAAIGLANGAINGFLSGVMDGNITAGIAGGVAGAFAGAAVGAVNPMAGGVAGGAAGSAVAAYLSGKDVFTEALIGGATSFGSGLVGAPAKAVVKKSLGNSFAKTNYGVAATELFGGSVERTAGLAFETARKIYK